MRKWVERKGSKEKRMSPIVGNHTPHTPRSHHCLHRFHTAYGKSNFLPC